MNISLKTIIISNALRHLFTGEFGIVYRACLTRFILRKTECEIVAVKTIKGKGTINYGVIYISTTSKCLPTIHYFGSDPASSKL